MNILLTGGAGYIGSHTAVSLFENGFNPIIVDNFSNSKKAAINHLSSLIDPLIFYELDARDTYKLHEMIKDYDIKGIVHLAAFKSISESIQNPLQYYDNNINSLISVLKAMGESNCNALVFSSSAVIYKENLNYSPISEKHEIEARNPYAHTKLFGEEILNRIIKLDKKIAVSILRYFNPVGAHPSCLIGEDPLFGATNLFPNVIDTISKDKPLKVFGNDYQTHDGTGVRDYIHVMDLADGHVASLEKLLFSKESHLVNLGTGQGYSVLDVVKAFEGVSKLSIKLDFQSRRPGDLGSVFSDSSLASKILSWRPRYDLLDMCQTSWEWSQNLKN